MQMVRWATLACLFGLLSACGGGGGGGGGGSTNQFRVTLHQTSLTFEYNENVVPLSQTVTASVTGTAPDPLFIGAVVEGTGIDQFIPLFLTETSASAQIRPTSGLAPGEYTGRIVFRACRDQGCTQLVGGTPLSIPYTIRVRALLRVTPSFTTIAAAHGAPASGEVVVRLPTGSTSFTATVPPELEWHSVSNLTATGFRVDTRGLPTGQYAGTVHVAAGTQSIDLSIPVQVFEAPTVELAAPTGQTASGEFVVPLAPHATSFTASVNGGTEWLSISTDASSVRLTARPLPPGNYSGGVQVVSGDNVTTQRVRFIVSGDPNAIDRDVDVTPANMTLSASEGAIGPAGTLLVEPPSWNPPLTTSVEYHTGNDWLIVTPVAGGYELHANAAQLQSGTYHASLSIHPGFPVHSPRSVPVAVTVGQGLVATNTVVVIDTETSASGLNGASTVNVAAGDPISWTASESSPWLTLTRSTGQSGTNIEFAIDADALATFTNFATRTATVTVTPSHPTMSAISFDVIVDKRIAEVTGVGPHTVLTGQPARLIVRGRGFTSIGNLAARLSIANATLSTIDLVNDTELVVETTPLSAGSHVIASSNGLGMATHTQALVAVDAQSYLYAAVTTGGNADALEYDPRRDALFVADSTTDNVLRFRHASGWVRDGSDTLAVPNLHGLGDIDFGDNLAVAADDIIVVDPDDLATVRTVESFVSFSPYERKVVTTNDGRSWVIFGSSNGSAYYFDPYATQVSAAPQLSLAARFLGLARDGERLIISNQPGYSIRFIDAATDVLTSSGSSLLYYHHFHSSDDGSRVLYNREEVRDQDFALIGRLTLSGAAQNDYSTRLAAAMSPDGSRAYLLTYHDADTTSDTTPPTHAPRIFVFDTTTLPVSGTDLPVLGYFDLPASDFPSCRGPGSDFNCHSLVREEIALDGRTLFLAGSKRLLVVPIPTESALSPLAVGATRDPISLQKTSGPRRTMAPRMYRWKPAARD